MNNIIKYITENPGCKGNDIQENIGGYKTQIQKKLRLLRVNEKVFCKYDLGKMLYFASIRDFYNYHTACEKLWIKAEKFHLYSELLEYAKSEHEAKNYIKTGINHGIVERKKVNNKTFYRWNVKRIQPVKPPVISKIKASYSKTVYMMMSLSELMLHGKGSNFILKLATAYDEKPLKFWTKEKPINTYLSDINKVKIKAPVSNLSKIIAGGLTREYVLSLSNLMTYKTLEHFQSKTPQHHIEQVKNYSVGSLKMSSKNQSRLSGQFEAFSQYF